MSSSYTYAIALAIALTTTLAYNTFGQDLTATGGRALGMAGSSILLKDEYSLFNNPGALTGESLSFVASYNTQYLDLGINDARLGLVVPFNNFITGFGVSLIGDDLFNQIKISSVFADEFGFASVALRLNYHQLYVKNYGYRKTGTIDIGGVFKLSEQLSLGMVFQNLTRSKLLGEADSPLQSLLQLGLSYRPIKKFRIDTQVGKAIDESLVFRLGLEYLVTDIISLRTGFSPSNRMGALGIGFNWNATQLDLAGQYQQQLGYSGILSIKVLRIK
jgi:hypothetical protein